LSRLEHFCCPRSIESVASLAVFSRYQVQLGNACREALLRDVEIYLVPMRQRGNEKKTWQRASKLNLVTSLRASISQLFTSSTHPINMQTVIGNIKIFLFGNGLLPFFNGFIKKLFNFATLNTNQMIVMRALI